MVLLEDPDLGVPWKGYLLHLFIDWGVLVISITTYLYSQRLVSESVAFFIFAGGQNFEKVQVLSASKLFLSTYFFGCTSGPVYRCLRRYNTH
jgi:hypothetical protein